MIVKCSSCGKQCSMSPVKFSRRRPDSPFRCKDCCRRTHSTVSPDLSMQRKIKELALFRELFS
jgi:transposase-like protein